MKKFLLALLVPFLMVSGMFAVTLENVSTDYDGDDVTIKFYEYGDGGFNFEIVNESDDTIYVDYEESATYGLNDDWEVETEPLPIFTEDEIDDDLDFIDGGHTLESERYYFDSDDYDIWGYYIVIEIDDVDYTWKFILADD